MILLPALGPGVGEVYDQDQLDDDEQEATDHSEVHPGGPKVTVGDEESPDTTSNDDQVLQAPETILRQE